MIRENAWGLGTKFQKRIWGEGHKLAEVYPYVDLAAICGYCVCIVAYIGVTIIGTVWLLCVYCGLYWCEYHTPAPASV